MKGNFSLDTSSGCYEEPFGVAGGMASFCKERPHIFCRRSLFVE